MAYPLPPLLTPHTLPGPTVLTLTHPVRVLCVCVRARSCLRTGVQLFLNVRIFHTCGSDVLLAIAERLGAQIGLPGEYLLRQGLRVPSLFLLSRGRAIVLHETVTRSNTPKGSFSLKSAEKSALKYPRRKSDPVAAAAAAAARSFGDMSRAGGNPDRPAFKRSSTVANLSEAGVRVASRPLI